jgi:hypothetical protein
MIRGGSLLAVELLRSQHFWKGFVTKLILGNRQGTTPFSCFLDCGVGIDDLPYEDGPTQISMSSRCRCEFLQISFMKCHSTP